MDDISEKTIRAAAGLYGIVHVRHLCEIVEHYTGKRYSRAQLNQMMDEQDWHPLRREQGFIYRPDAFAALAEWNSVLARAKGKPFWMPPLTQFLQYADLDHLPVSASMQALQALFSTQIPEAEAKQLIRDMHGDLRKGAAMSQVMKRMMDAGIRIDPVHMRRFGDLLAQLCNETRMFMNHGFTPQELMKRTG